MLVAYTYVSHTMEKMQEYIDFIFFEVWCKAQDNGSFRLELFDSNPELHEVMESFYYSDKKNADFFYGSVEKIYGHFSNLNEKQVRKLKWWYLSNNDIERLCRNDSGCHITLYSDLKRKFPTLVDDVNKFFTGLYDFDAAVLKKKVGAIDEHYQAFMQANTTGKCPFCGITDMLGVYHTKREAYDHYLPKGLYPFNSINFKNLVPACHYCNSSYKTTKNPGYTAKDPVGDIHRRKAFYPYARTRRRIEITIDFASSNIEAQETDNIQLTFGPTDLSEEIETWKDVYGIEERYKAKCCSPDAKDWLENMRIMNDCGMDPNIYLATVAEQTDGAPLANSNFLKKAFLEGCQRLGIFEAIIDGREDCCELT